MRKHSKEIPVGNRVGEETQVSEKARIGHKAQVIHLARVSETEG